jgi:hypothetical protein
MPAEPGVALLKPRVAKHCWVTPSAAAGSRGFEATPELGSKCLSAVGTCAGKCENTDKYCVSVKS